MLKIFKNWIKFLKNIITANSGAITAEFAVVLPMFAILIVVILALFKIIMIQQKLEFVSQQAARSYVLHEYLAVAENIVTDSIKDAKLSSETQNDNLLCITVHKNISATKFLKNIDLEAKTCVTV